LDDVSDRMEVRWGDGVPVLTLIGEWDRARKDELHEQFRNLREANCSRVVVDLSQTRFLDSTALGAMLRAHRDGLEISIRDASTVAQRVLEVAGLTAVFDPE
jgi:anti-anti-sigma factor